MCKNRIRGFRSAIILKKGKFYLQESQNDPNGLKDLERILKIFMKWMTK